MSVYKCSTCGAFGIGLEKSCPRPAACRGRRSSVPYDTRAASPSEVKSPKRPTKKRSTKKSSAKPSDEGVAT